MGKVAVPKPVVGDGKRESHGSYRAVRKPNSKWVKNGWIKTKKKEKR